MGYGPRGEGGEEGTSTFPGLLDSFPAGHIKSRGRAVGLSKLERQTMLSRTRREITATSIGVKETDQVSFKSLKGGLEVLGGCTSEGP